MLRLIFAAVLLVHGVIHVMGFLVAWKLATFEGIAYSTALVGGNWDLGATAVQVLGILWLAAMLGFVAAGFALLLRRDWWWIVTVATALFSLVLTVLQWPDTQFGLYTNGVVLAILIVVRNRPIKASVASVV